MRIQEIINRMHRNQRMRTICGMEGFQSLLIFFILKKDSLCSVSVFYIHIFMIAGLIFEFPIFE